jgi:hypothetical protein
MASRIGAFLRNPFSFLFSRTSQEDRLAAYVIREHDRGRALDEVMNDPYVRNRATPQQVARLLDRPDVIHALGEGAVSTARDRLT